MTRLGPSAPAYTRIVAGRASAETVEPPHVAEAIQYRKLDRAAG